MSKLMKLTDFSPAFLIKHTLHKIPLSFWFLQKPMWGRRQVIWKFIFSHRTFKILQDLSKVNFTYFSFIYNQSYSIWVWLACCPPLLTLLLYFLFQSLSFITSLYLHFQSPSGSLHSQNFHILFNYDHVIIQPSLRLIDIHTLTAIYCLISV